MNFLKKLILYLDVSFRLGIGNSLYALWYKLSLKTGLRYILCKLRCNENPILNQEPFFKGQNCSSIDLSSYLPAWKQPLVEDADRILAGNFKFFAYDWKVLGQNPEWLLNPYTNKKICSDLSHWTKFSEFQSEVGDIKCIWEASRFEWVLTLARAFAVTKEEKYLKTLNKYLKTWVDANPVGLGPNWRCGQEASIRCFHVLFSFLILGDTELSSGLESFLLAHIERINFNINYALAQDNNHGTSEATGLYIIGMFLEHQARDPRVRARGQSLKIKGKNCLEKVVAKLVMKEGSFSQHSTNYHRLMLDTLSLAEFFRRRYGQEEFSPLLKDRIEGAVDWLSNFVDSESGDAVNLGANDGAMICAMHSCDYRDYRPSVQLSSALFNLSIPFDEGNYDEPLIWLGLKVERKENPAKDCDFKEGGYLVRREEKYSLYYRLPKYKFRPSHCDVMHIDLWAEGENLLTDGGSYSYNDKTGVGRSLKSAMAHNTVEFDNADSMPHVSRFLYGKWLNGSSSIEGKLCKAKYLDYRGNSHERGLEIFPNGFRVIDKISGSFRVASMYWHLSSKYDWVLSLDRENLGISCSKLDMKFTGEAIKSISLISCPRSLYYNQLSYSPVLKVELSKGEVISEVSICSE